MQEIIEFLLFRVTSLNMIHILDIDRFYLLDTKLLKEGSFVEYIVFFDFWTVVSVYKHQKAFYLFLSTFPL